MKPDTGKLPRSIDGDPLRATVIRAAILIALWISAFTIVPSVEPDKGAHCVFVWADVAGVYLAGALPVAAVLCQFATRKQSRGMSVTAALAGLVVLFVLARIPFAVPDSIRSSFSGLVLLRTGLALVVASAACLSGRTLSSGSRMARIPRPAVLVGLTVTCGLIVPIAYTHERCEYHQKRVEELLGQYRLGQGERLASQLARALPDVTINGHPIKDTLVALQRELSRIRIAVEADLPSTALPVERIERGRLLAILGRHSAALIALKPLNPATQVRSDDRNTIATIYEACGEWQQSLRWYQAAAHQLRPASDMRPIEQAGLAIALKGIAYCRRKQGHLNEASVAYEAALELTPTAEMHFLLAQFYEDNQYASKARFHARRSMLLDPFRYGTPGQDLIDRLMTSHFGCLSVYTDEHMAGDSASR